MNQATRYTLALLLPLFASLALTPLAGRLAHRIGLIDHPKGNRFHSRATPYLGGLAIAGSLLIVGVAAAGAQRQLLVIVLGAVAMAGVGLVDDLRGLGPAPKLAAEAAAAIALWSAGLRIGLTDVALIDLTLTVVWVLAVTNSVNLLDNMDGVAGSVAAVASFGIFAVAALEGQYLVASLALALAGGCLGFVAFNLPPARIFMGDAGALFLGFALAALGLKLEVHDGGPIARSATAVLLLAVPLFDMMLVVADRLRGGRSLVEGGTDHTAHRLAHNGHSPRLVVARIVLAQVICSLAAVTVAFSSEVTAAIVAGSAGIAALGMLRLVIRIEAPTRAHAPEIAGATR